MIHKTILLVEDNSDDELLTIRALEKNNLANQIDVARDGAEALDYIYHRGVFADRDPSSPPQLILLDLQLPKVDGLDVLKAIRQDKHFQHIPVVMLTTSSEENDIVSSYQNGANSFIMKPVDFKEFVEIVSQLGIYWMAINKTPQN